MAYHCVRIICRMGGVLPICGRELRSTNGGHCLPLVATSCVSMVVCFPDLLSMEGYKMLILGYILIAVLLYLVCMVVIYQLPPSKDDEVWFYVTSSIFACCIWIYFVPALLLLSATTLVGFVHYKITMNILKGGKRR